MAREPNAVKQKRYRERKRKHLRVLHVPVHDAFIETLITSGWLSEREALTQAGVSDALAEIAVIWTKKWRAAN